MPLTRRLPPIPVKAIHVAELAQAEADYAAAMYEYLDLLLERLCFPRTEWLGGTGQSANPSSVSASIGPPPTGTGTTSAPLATLSSPQTTGAVSGRRVLAALHTSGAKQRRTFANYFEGVPFRVQASTSPPPLNPAAPVEPPPVDMSDLDEDNYVAWIEARATYNAGALDYALIKLWRERFAWVTRWYYGTVQSVNTAAKTAKVLLDPAPDSREQATQVCGFGTIAWTAGNLGGKHVRVGWNRASGWFVDDWSG